MTEILFYHLERQGLEEVLPTLLEKCLARGWRAVVQVTETERLAALNAHLWTYRDDSFLPHGAAGDGFEAEQPVWLTTGSDTPNGATVRFLADGARIDDPGSFERVIVLFDGRDEAALADARAAWKTFKAAGHDLTYWQQNPRGGWEKKA